MSAETARDIVVAIDGPAGAGKSTVAKIVAQRLGLRYLDTGAMYRCVALLASREGLGPEQAEQVATLAEPSEIRFGDGDPQPVYLNGEEVTLLIRTPELSQLASALSAHSAIRQVLARRQMKIVAEGGYVLEGRDTTSVVAPNAEVKVYLTASIEERAERRRKEMEARGESVDLNDLMKQIAERDARDINRADSPLRRVPDALAVETYGLTPEQVAEKIIERALSVSR